MLDEIEKSLSNEDVEVRREAAIALKGLGSSSPAPARSTSRPAVIKLLIRAMHDQSWRVRKTAVRILLEEYEIDEYIADLIGMLYLEENAGARNTAIEALTELGKKVTSHLIEAFDTQNNDVRKFVIDVLGGFRDPRSRDLMLKALKDEDENVSASAVEHIGALGDPTVVDALIEVLEHGELWTAFPAADALGRIGDVRAVDALVASLKRKPLREPVLKALASLGGQTELRHIVPLMDGASKSVQEEALKAVEALYHRGIGEDVVTGELKKHFGQTIIDVLLEHTQSAKPDVMGSAILLLGLMKDEKALESLLELALDVQFADDVKRALVFIGRDKPAALLQLLNIDDPYKRRFISDVLADVAAEAYFEPAVQMLRDEDGHVRANAARCLANIGDERAVEPVMELFTDEYVDVQDSAVEVLSKFAASLDADRLVAGLGHRDSNIRANNLMLLGKINAVRAVPAIGFALKDEEIRVRHAAVTALSMIRTADALKHSIMAMTDENPDIRASAALSLGTTGNTKALEPLVLLLNDPEDMVRVTAARSLGMLGDQRAVSALISMLSDDNGLVVAISMESLGKVGGAEAREALKKTLSSKGGEIRRTAIKALSAFDDVQSYILPYINDKDWATRMAAVEGLGGSPGEPIRAELEKHLDIEEDPAVRKAIENVINA